MHYYYYYIYLDIETLNTVKDFVTHTVPVIRQTIGKTPPTQVAVFGALEDSETLNTVT